MIALIYVALICATLTATLLGWRLRDVMSQMWHGDPIATKGPSNTALLIACLITATLYAASFWMIHNVA